VAAFARRHGSPALSAARGRRFRGAERRFPCVRRRRARGCPIRATKRLPGRR
jgi:hypothetical protein